MRLRNVAGIFLSFVSVAVSCFSQQPSGMAPANRVDALRSGRKASYARLPLAFEANQGQTSLQTKFRAHGIGYSASLTVGGMVLTLRPTELTHGNSTEITLSQSAAQRPDVTIQFKLVGANPSPVIVGEDQQPGHVNYFIGSDPAKWHRNVPIYAKVRYKNIYPGTDLVYYGNSRQLEYDFVLAPGADPTRIQFAISGTDHIVVDAEGNLILKASSGELRFQYPIVYQESGGRRLTVDGRYIVTDPTHVGFYVAEHDRSKPLVIDPTLAYSTYLGGVGAEQPTGIAVDSNGSVYVAGYTNSDDFSLTTIGQPSISANHVFVAKLDPTGSGLMYADYIGGDGNDYGVGLALDNANNVYVTGSTTSSDFPVVKPYQAVKPGPYSGFLSKISADGSSLLYSTYLGGNGFDQPAGVAVDTLGEAYIAGGTTSQNFPVVNAYQATASSNQAGLFGTYGFVSKFSADDSSLIYSTYLAGNSNVAQDCGSPCWPAPYTAVSAVAVDANGNAYVTGTTNTYNYPTTYGTYLSSNATQQDATIGFVSKLGSSGSLGYSTYFYGSSGNPVGIEAVAVDGSGSAYIVGTVSSDGTFPITTTAICDPDVYGFGCSYGFVTKFDPTASTLLYSTFLGPNNYASPQSIALDLSNNAYVLANTESAAFGTNNGIEGYTSGKDILLVEIDASASAEPFSTYLGGSSNDSASGISVDANGNIYVAGSTDSADFPVTQGAFQGLLGGSVDAFVVRIGTNSAPAVSLSPPSVPYAAQPVGSTSQVRAVLLRNMGAMPLSVSSITVTGDFAETDDCGTSVPADSSCVFSVTFTPTGVGSRSGSILIHDNASGSPHVVNLSGSGLGAMATLSPASLAFSSQPVGTSSSAQAVTITNTGNVTLTIGSIGISGDFAEINSCPATLASNSSCTISVNFAPTVAGTRNGTLSITDNAQGNPQTVNLSGVALDFSLASSPNSATVKAGKTAMFQLAISPLGGAFNNAVKLSCGGAPTLTTCSISPTTVTPNSNAASATLTITTTASVAQSVPLRSSSDRILYAMWMPLQGVGLFGMILVGRRVRFRTRGVLILLTLMTTSLLFMSGCAGGTGITTPPQSGTTPGTYTITVTGTSGALQHSMPVTLIVQ
jgi:hypothetical protein